MKHTLKKTIELNGRKVDYRLIQSKRARKLRVRVSIDGVEVVQPVEKNSQELNVFLKSNQDWIIQQIDRIKQFSSIRKPHSNSKPEILFRGDKTAVRVDENSFRKGTNKVVFENGTLTVLRGLNSRTTPAKTLENWLRKQAKQEIFLHLNFFTEKLGRYPNKVYIMGQRTKWGNCSSLQNLSFNWRLIMAPDYVIRYLVAHEVVHLAVPDHSQRFWLTLQGLCPEMEQAKQWLRVNTDRLMVDIKQVCKTDKKITGR